MFSSNYSPNTQQVLQGMKRSLDHNHKTPFATVTGRENLLLENEWNLGYFFIRNSNSHTVHKNPF